MKTILVGVDGSESSLAALAWAAEMAKPLDATVIAAAVFDVQHVIAMSGGYAAMASSWPEQWRHDLQRDLDGTWTEALRGGNTKIRTVVAEGHPPDVLMNLAEKHQADLIVVGSRGRGSIRELFLGSVSHNLTLQAPCPVVVVPHRHDGAAERGTNHTAATSPAIGVAGAGATAR